MEIVRPSDWNQKSAVGFIYNGTQTNKRPVPEVENLYFNVGGSTSQYMLNSNLKLTRSYTPVQDRDFFSGDYLIQEDYTSLTITEVGKKHGLYTFFGQMGRYATYGDNASTYEYLDTDRFESYDYTKNKISLGTRVTYFGDLTLTGFGYNGDGINPEVPSDADENVFLPELFNYSGKFSTDIYSNIQLSKKVNFIFGADNIFNVHPDFAVNPQAKYWAGDNETGGPWDGVQMGYNGLRLFTKLAFRF